MFSNQRGDDLATIKQRKLERFEYIHAPQIAQEFLRDRASDLYRSTTEGVLEIQRFPAEYGVTDEELLASLERVARRFDLEGIQFTITDAEESRWEYNDFDMTYTDEVRKIRRAQNKYFLEIAINAIQQLSVTTNENYENVLAEAVNESLTEVHSYTDSIGGEVLINHVGADKTTEILRGMLTALADVDTVSTNPVVESLNEGVNPRTDNQRQGPKTI